MNPTLLRILAFLGSLLFVSSFLSALSGSPIPSLSALFSFSLSLSLLRGFRRAWPTTALAGFLFDLATFRVPGISAAFCAGLAYATGFSSRRIVTEHGPFLSVVGGVAVSVGVVGHLAVSAAFFGGAWNLSAADLFPILVSGLVSFWAVDALLRRFDRRISSMESAGFIR